jgi:hypothetical protein
VVVGAEVIGKFLDYLFFPVFFGFFLLCGSIFDCLAEICGGVEA